GSSSTVLTETVDKATTTTAIASSANPSIYGQNMTFTAAVTSGATGWVQFLDGAVLLGSAAISGGNATFSISSLAVGSHSITASYGGDLNFSGSASTALTDTLNKASTTTTVASGVNPSTFGQNVTLTATVTTGATGSVQFSDGGVSLGNGVIS